MIPGSDADCDLLARLNALKRSNIDLDNKIVPSVPIQSVPIDPAPGRALHADLLDRFKSLSGGGKAGASAAPNPAATSDDDTNVGDNRLDDEKTVEELLADLGPAEQWDGAKSEHDEVDDLLRSANAALRSKPDLEKIPGEESDDASRPREHAMPSIDVSAFRPEPESDDEETGQRPSKDELKVGFNQEADDVLQRLLDEVRYEQKHEASSDNKHDHEANESEDDDNDNGRDQGNRQADKTSTTTPSTHAIDDTLNLPSAPSTLPSPPPSQAEDDLAARFASLGLPSVPSTIRSASSKGPPSSSTTKSKAPTYSDDEIDSWCIICNDDATLSCLGCDEDLYCTNCWLEGHRGEDAGEDEKRHKAVQYNKRKKKAKTGRALVGA